jgi:chromosome segregation protein
MIRLGKMRLKNFKSFKKADISFHPGFTAIAGANASGKSNILDALLFVLGATSLKMLRASKLTDLVNHDASEDYALVEIEIDENEKKYVISRTIDTRGQSVVRLDGKRKTLNEVTSLLLELGIKATGHNIVVQGDVTRVIEMSPKHRRQIIDEVAGLSEFEEKKAEAIQKLEKVEERINDATIVLNERRKVLGNLEAERAAAERYLFLKEELRKSKATIISEETKRISLEMERLDREIQEAKEEIGRREKERSELIEQENSLEQKLEEITRQLIEAGEKTYSTIGREIEEKKSEIKISRERIENKKSRIDYLANSLLKYKAEIKDLRIEQDDKEKEVRSLNERLATASEKIKFVSGQIDQKSGRINSKDMASSESKMKELVKEIDSLKERIHEKSINEEKMLKEKEIEEKMLRELLEEKSSLEKKLEARKSSEALLKQVASVSNSTLEQKEKELDVLLNELHHFRTKIEHVNSEIEKLKELKAKCPTCEQPIDKNAIEALLKARKERVQTITVEIQKKTNAKERLESERQKIREQLVQKGELSVKLKGFEEVQERFSRVTMQANELKEKGKAQHLQKVQAEKNELSKQLQKFLSERQLLQDKIDVVKKSNESLELNELLGKFNEMNEERISIENRLAVIKTEMVQRIEKGIDERNRAIANYERDQQACQKDLELLETGIKEPIKELGEKEKEMLKATESNKVLEEQKERLQVKVKNIEEKKEKTDERISRSEKQINEINITKSKNEVRLADLKEEFVEYADAELIKQPNIPELREKIPSVEKEIKSLGAVNMKALESFEEKKKEVDELTEKANKLDEERKAVLEMIDKIELKKLGIFMKCFDEIGKKFSELYYLFFEGEGKLGLENQQNPLEGGLTIEAKYNEEKLKSIDAMSGGEKSLTALAFLFAIQSYEPAPFYIFDEVDAALDKENSLKLGKMIANISKKSQFISITHNDSVIKEANQIIGVALNKQKSSVIGLRLKEEMQEKAES